MRILKACGGLSASDCSRLARTRALRRAIFLWTLLACGRILAQSAPTDDGSADLERYAKQLAILQEARFSFSSKFTRSTPKEGLVARWESYGTMRVSASRKSFHCTAATTLTELRQAKTSQYLGIREKLVTPTVFLDVAIQNEGTSATSANQFSIDAKSKSVDDEWSNELGRHELGILFGYVSRRNIGMCFLDICRSVPIELLTEKKSDSHRYSGFLAKHEAMEIRAVFDPSVDPLIKHVRLSCVDPANKVDDIVNAEVTLLEIAYRDSMPAAMKLNITLKRAGGTINRAILLKIPGVKRPETIEIEPQTWSYNYEIKDIHYRDDHGDWFTLDHPIPNESAVVLDDDQNSSYVWRNEKIHKTGIDDFELLVPKKETKEETTANDEESRKTIPPLSERFTKVVRNVRLCGMHCLVILEGNSTPGNTSAREVNLNHPYLLPYLPLVLNQDATRTNESMLETLGWPRPKADEVVLVAINGDSKMLGTQRIKFDKASDEKDAQRSATAFLKKHRPAVHDAQAKLAAALAEANRTNRKVCVVVSGVRCGPCFRLARWMETQHALLDKDYVTVKIMVEIDSHVQKVLTALDLPQNEGVPYFAIMDAEGKVRVTSEGPMGNIGMPSTPEDFQHVREMLATTAKRLTAAEIDAVVKSLADFN